MLDKEHTGDQRTDDSLRRAQPSRRQMKNLQDEATFLSSVIRLLTPDTRHLKPVLLKKKIDINDPYFVNYLRDKTLVDLKDKFRPAALYGANYLRALGIAFFRYCVV